MLNSNVNMAYGGETLTEQEKQRVKDVLTGLFWEFRKRGKEKWAYMEMDIIKLVSELKRTYDTANPFVIAEKLGIEIRYVSFLDNPKGQFQELLGSPIILLNNSLKESEERFYICAHELGHALFHREISSYYVSSRNSRSKSESEANCFASNLIVSLYKEDTETYPREVEELTRLYGLPESCYRFLI